MLLGILRKVRGVGRLNDHVGVQILLTELLGVAVVVIDILLDKATLTGGEGIHIRRKTHTSELLRKTVLFC